MKEISVLIISILIFSSLFIKCDKSDNIIDTKESQFADIEELPHLMKGYELYSWQKDDNFVYTLLPGTNRIKTFEEISGDNKIEEEGEGFTSISYNDLKVVITKLPDDELIFWEGANWIELAWGSNPNNICLPSEKVQNDLLKYCNEHNVRLSIVD